MKIYSCVFVCFIVSPLAFKFVINSELIILCDVSWSSNLFFCVWISTFPRTICWKGIFPCSFVKINWLTMNVKELISGLWVLFRWSVHLSGACCGSVVSFEVRKCVCHLLQGCGCCVLHFHMSFRMFVNFYKHKSSQNYRSIQLRSWNACVS